MRSNFIAYIKSFAWANRKWGWWKMSKYLFFCLVRTEKIWYKWWCQVCGKDWGFVRIGQCWRQRQKSFVPLILECGAVFAAFFGLLTVASMFVLRQVNNQRDHEVSFANKWHGIRTHLLPRPNKRVSCHFLFSNYWSVKTPASKVLCPLDSG